MLSIIPIAIPLTIEAENNSAAQAPMSTPSMGLGEAKDSVARRLCSRLVDMKRSLFFEEAGDFTFVPWVMQAKKDRTLLCRGYLDQRISRQAAEGRADGRYMHAAEGESRGHIDGGESGNG